MSDRPTPETDARTYIPVLGASTVPAEFARKLERERDEAREELRMASISANALATSIQKSEYSDVKNFELCESVAGVISQIDNMYAGVRQQRDEAREAAAKWESSSDAMERAGAEQARRADENREWALKAERERDEAREALDRASLYISNFTGSCPYDLFDIEPHDSPCSEVCDKYANDMHLCWKKHFANKEAAK